MKTITAAALGLFCFGALAGPSVQLDVSEISSEKCASIIEAFQPYDGGSWAEPFPGISNSVAEARSAVAAGEDCRKAYARLITSVAYCPPPEEVSRKASYYKDKYWLLDRTVKLVLGSGGTVVAKNMHMLELCARFVGQMRLQHEVYKDAVYVIDSGVYFGECDDKCRERERADRLNNQKAGVECTLRRILSFNGKGPLCYLFYGMSIYSRCMDAGLSPEFVDRLAVLAKVPSGTFRPNPQPKQPSPEDVKETAQTNCVAVSAAPATEESPWPEPHPAYYDDVDEMWEGEDNGGDSYWYRISEMGWGRCMKDTAPEADLVPQEIKPEGTLAGLMHRYGMNAYRVGKDDKTYRFILYVPKTGRKGKVPLIVYFPGNGEIGEDLTRQFNQSGLFDKVTSPSFQMKHPCALIAVSPPKKVLSYYSGCMKGHPGGTMRLFHRRFCRMLNSLGDIVDANRVYLTGFSWGGHAVYALGMYYCNEFAAMFPIATVATAARNVNEKHPGNWWHVANEKDRVADEGCREDVEAFRKKVISFGGDFQVSYFPDNGHDAWTNAWKEDQIWDWMFSKSLEQGKAAGREGRRDGRLAISMADAKCSASVPGADATCGPERVIDLMQRTAYVAARNFTDKDWWMVELPNPVEGEVRMTSGDAKGRGKLKGAYAEVSIDGKSWVRGGGFSKETGECRFTPRQPFRFLRVRSALTSPQHFELRQLLILSEKQ